MASFNYDVMPNLPKIKKGRSKFNLSHTSHLDFNAGLLVPLDRPIPVLPGDSFDVGQRIIIRMSNPPKVPVMDTLCMTVAWYYVPYRILWSNWDKFITGDNGTQWDQDLSLTIPTITLTSAPSGSNKYSSFDATQGHLLDFLGVTPNFPEQTLDTSDVPVLSTSISAFESLGYYRIWNDFYRYTPLMDEIVLSKTTTSYTLNESLTYTNGVVSNALCPVVRFADYFSRCLPQPQRGADVLMDLSIPENFDGTSLHDINFLFANGGTGTLNTSTASSANIGDWADLTAMNVYNAAGNGIKGFVNLYGGSINQLREAFAIQALKDIDAKYGTRITDWSYGHFGVTVPNSLVQMPEELSYQTFDINVNQVVQTSSTTADSPQGTVGAYSATSWDKHSFFKSFTEYGLIYNLGCIRVKHHSYSQGLDAQFMRKTRFDYYIPELANIADQPVYKRELSFGVVIDDSGDLDEAVMDESVFGYQEAWAAYKFLPSRLSNHMRPNATDTLAIWNYADYYDSTPTLSSDWIIEPTTNIDRTMFLASDDDVTQFICDIFYKISAFRTMPYHSIPGGLTHEF